MTQSFWPDTAGYSLGKHLEVTLCCCMAKGCRGSRNWERDDKRRSVDRSRTSELDRKKVEQNNWPFIAALDLDTSNCLVLRKIYGNGCVWKWSKTGIPPNYYIFLSFYGIETGHFPWIFQWIEEHYSHQFTTKHWIFRWIFPWIFQWRKVHTPPKGPSSAPKAAEWAMCLEICWVDWSIGMDSPQFMVIFWLVLWNFCFPYNYWEA